MKKIFSFSIEEKVIRDLDEFCKDGLITKSKLINKIIQDFINSQKNKNNNDNK